MDFLSDILERSEKGKHIYTDTITPTPKENQMFKGKQRLVMATGKPVLTTFMASFIEKSDDAVREVARQKDRSYTSIKSACNQGLALKALTPAVSIALDEAIMEACSVDTTSADNRLAEEALKQQLKTYQKAA